MTLEEDRADIEILKTAIRSVVIAHGDDDLVSPYRMATEVIEGTTEHIRYLAAHLAIRQLIRGRLRRIHSSDPRQPPLPHLPLVHERYPLPSGRGYIKRELLSKEDCKFNVRRLRGKGGKLMAHGDQLEQWAKEWFPDYDEDDADVEETGS